jgi:PilZ domain
MQTSSMPPTPDKIEGQAKLPGRGLHLEALVTSPTWGIGLPATVHDFAPGEVVLMMDDFVSAGTPVTIQLNTWSFNGEILYCKRNGSRNEAHVSIDDADASGLRRSPRFPVSIPARVFTSLSEVPLEARIVDVSGEGLGIELGVTLPVAANIAVQSDENIALGEVRHCRPLASGLFRAGAQLHHIIRKDPGLVRAAAEEAGWMSKLGVRLGRKKEEGRR